MAPVNEEDEKSLVEQEAAAVQVLNGAGVEGLACLTEQYLLTQGVQANNCDTADRSDYTSSVIVDYTGNPYTVRYLARLFGVSTIISGADPNSLVDVKVIVGQDWKVPAN